jgi:hypothetical protein
MGDEFMWEEAKIVRTKEVMFNGYKRSGTRDTIEDWK